MARPFAITPTTEKLKLSDAAAPCETTITVSNASPSPRRCRVVVRATDPAKPDWFPIKDEPERMLKPGETTQFTVEVKVPSGTPQGTYQFRLDALDSDNPDEFATEGPAVGVELAATIIKPPPRPFPWWIVAVAAIVLIGGGVGVWMLLSNSGVAVPKITEMTFEEATTEIESQNLKIEAEMQVSDAKENTVVTQDPEPGTKLKKGETVKIVYEAPFVEIPGLVGMTELAAAEELKQRKLTLRSLTEQRVDPAKAGKVVAQSIPEKDRRRQGEEIDLTIEAPTVPVPDVTNKVARVAVEELKALGLEPTVKNVDRDRAQSGKILSQSHRPPAMLQRGLSVELEAQAGAIEVPPVAQKSVQEAKGLLEAKLLKWSMQSPQLFPPIFKVGEVGASDPPPGTPLVEGDTVKLIPVGRRVTVPDVTTMHLTQADATATLEKAGLVANVLYRSFKDAGITIKGPHKNDGRVVEQTPPANRELLEKSTVTIYVLTSKPIKVKSRADIKSSPVRVFTK